MKGENYFGTMNGGLEAMINFEPYEDNYSFQSPHGNIAHDDFVVMNFGNPLFRNNPQYFNPQSRSQSHRSAIVDAPLLPQHFNPQSQSQSGRSVAVDAPLLPQEEYVILEPTISRNPTSFPIPKNLVLDSSTWVPHGNMSNFQDGFGNQQSKEIYNQHIAFQEVDQSIAFNVKATSSYERRHRRFEARRELRFKKLSADYISSVSNKRDYKKVSTSRHGRQPKDEIRFSEKGWELLVQKQLGNTDVGSLGRIVLHKREAEANLPHLDNKEGIPIFAEDLECNKTWPLKYRYWPNNKSRMYILENTGKFVETHNLRAGDYMMLYKDAHDKFRIKARKAIESGLNSPNTDSKPMAEVIPLTEDGIGKISPVNNIDPSHCISKEEEEMNGMIGEEDYCLPNLSRFNDIEWDAYFK